jgi:hypothetical protein
MPRKTKRKKYLESLQKLIVLQAMELDDLDRQDSERDCSDLDSNSSAEEDTDSELSYDFDVLCAHYMTVNPVDISSVKVPTEMGAIMLPKPSLTLLNVVQMEMK